MMDSLTLWRLAIVVALGFTLWFVLRDLKRGYCRLNPAMPEIRREDRPRLYWASILLWIVYFAVMLFLGVQFWSGPNS